MNKRKRMAALKHRRHLRKLKEKRRAQALLSLEQPAEVSPPEAVPAPKRGRRKKAEEVSPPEVVAAPKRGRRKKVEEVSLPEVVAAPKKRGRKKKTETPEIVSPEK